ncbi:MAG: ATP-binding protein [Chloroflexi bacterium]|nr:ATP-binding protein [Chloroflexota bacterium]
MRPISIERRAFEGGVEQLTAIRDFVTRVVRQLGAHDDDLFACELATDEAASNAYEHAYTDRGGPIEVKIWREPDAIVIAVRNWGAPFDPASVQEPDLDAPLHQRQVGGLGIFLIRKLMQDVSFAFDPIQGNTLTMRRVLTRA